MTDELPLLEREREVSITASAVAAALAGTGQFVLIEGEPGIGKSRLAMAAAQIAREQGARVLRTRATELEQGIPYGVATALLEPLARAETGAVRAPDGPAAAVNWLFGLSGDAAGPTDPFVPVHGLYWLVLDAVERTPVVLIVDDVQWSDSASLRFLQYLAQRVTELPVTLVVTLRSGAGHSQGVAAQLATVPGAVVLRPAPLSAGAVTEAVVHVLGTAAGDRHHEIWEATRGNPFYLSEVLRSLRDEPGATARVPPSVVDFVTTRIARLDREAGALAEAIAVLGDSATPGRVARLAGTDEVLAMRGLRRLTEDAILDPGPELAFVHPVVQGAVYEAMPAIVRARAHRDAALLLRTDGLPAGVIGAQLLEAERSGNATIVDLLVEASDSAVRRGEPGTAVLLLRRAIAEPPTRAQLATVLVALGRAEAMAGDPAAAETLERALERIDDAGRRASVLLELGHVLISATDWVGAADIFERGLRELGTEPGAGPSRAPDSSVGRELAERLEVGFVSAAWVTIARRPEAERAIARILDGPSLGSVHRSLAVWSAFQRGTVVSAPAAQLADITLRALAETPIEVLITEGQIVEVAAGVLIATDELTTEVEFLTRAIAAAEEAGLFGKVGLYSYCRTWPMLFLGRLADCVADAQAALRVAELGWETFVPASRAALAIACLERGELGAADDALELDGRVWGHRMDYQLLIPIARGRLALARGDVDGALQQFAVAAGAPAAAYFRALGPSDWRGWMAVALSHAGRRDEARALAAEVLGIAHESGARWTLGCALRVAGIAEGGRAGLEQLHASVDALERSPALLELARSQAELGRALRQQGLLRDARTVLVDAMDLAHRVGATALLDQSRDELRAAGARPRRYARTGVEALTPSELRVVRLAATGRTNREIAQALFVTPKAVEFHLANAYPKLGVAARSELGAVLGEP